MLKVSAGQLSAPVRVAFALLPAETIEQYVAPAEEYEPLTKQRLQPDPVAENVPAGQSEHCVSDVGEHDSETYLPGPQVEH